MSTTIHKTSKIIPSDYRAGFVFAMPEQDMPGGMNYSLLLACKSGKSVQEPVFTLRDGFAHVTGHRDVQPLKGFENWASERVTQCDVCGARFKYGEVWTHIESNESIVIGHDCAEKFELLQDMSKLEAYRKDAAQARKLGRNRLERKKALRTFVKDAGKDLLSALKTDHHITKSIRSSMIQWAGKSDRPMLTVKQDALIRKLWIQSKEPKAPVEANVAAPLSDDRQLITGTIVSIKSSEGYYGGMRMTVKVTTDKGVWLCNGSLPALSNWSHANDYYGSLRGCEIQFNALMNQAPRDTHFAFFKRPTKAKITKGGESQKTALTDLVKIISELNDNHCDEYVADLKRVKKNLEGMF